MVHVTQQPTESMPHEAYVKGCGWDSALHVDTEPLDQDFESKAGCPVCRRIDGLLQIGDVIFCAACGYASDGVAGCT